MNSKRGILLLFGVLLLGLTLTAGVIFMQTDAELDALQAQEAESRRRLAEAQSRLDEQQNYLRLLKENPLFVERIIRRKLGYARPDEIVFRFER